MPSNNRKQQVRQTSTGQRPSTLSSARTDRKAQGTRWGTLEDWREASNGAESTSGRHGHAIRDGGR